MPAGSAPYLLFCRQAPLFSLLYLPAGSAVLVVIIRVLSRAARKGVPCALWMTFLTFPGSLFVDEAMSRFSHFYTFLRFNSFLQHLIANNRTFRTLTLFPHFYSRSAIQIPLSIPFSIPSSPSIPSSLLYCFAVLACFYPEPRERQGYHFCSSLPPHGYPVLSHF